MPADLFSPQYFPPYFSEVIISGPTSDPFIISATVSGSTNFIVGRQVYLCPVTATINGTALYGYVAILDALAMRMSSADLSLWIAAADVVKFRSDEVRARVQLYRVYQQMLARDMGGQEYVSGIGGVSNRGGATA